MVSNLFELNIKWRRGCMCVLLYENMTRFRQTSKQKSGVKLQKGPTPRGA